MISMTTEPNATDCGTAVAQPFARRLTGAYYNGDLILQAHANLIADCPSTDITGVLTDGKVHSLGIN